MELKIETHFQAAALLMLTVLLPLAGCNPGRTGGEETCTTTVFTSGTDGYSHYRIPALALNKEFLFAFAEGRRYGSADHGEISIVLKRSSDHGHTWGQMILAVEAAGGSAQNPTPVWVEDTGTLLLLFTRRTVGSDTEHMIRSGTSEGYMGVYRTESHDQGLTWSVPEEITGEVKQKNWYWYALGPGGAVTIRYNTKHRGRIIVPANHSLDGGSSNEYLGAHVIYSDDRGRTWSKGAVDSEGQGTVNPNETAVVELTDGTLYFNTRNHNGEDTIAHRAITTSRDGGETFSFPFRHEPGLTTPIVHASLTRNATTLFFVAPHDQEDRINLSLWTSSDEASTWALKQTVYEGPSAYSSICMLSGQMPGILFEADDYGKIIFKSLFLQDMDPG